MIPNYGWHSKHARDVQFRAAQVGLELRDVERHGRPTGERAYWAGPVRVSEPIATPTRAAAWLDGWGAAMGVAATRDVGSVTA